MSEKVNKPKTSRDLPIDELRLLGVALDLSESPITLYGENIVPIYANAAARSCWPVTFEALDNGKSMEAATKSQIEAFDPGISDAEIHSRWLEFLEGFKVTEPTLIHGANSRILRTTHHPIGDIAIAGMAIDVTELRNKRQELRAARTAAEFRAAHDALTSLPNREQFRKIVESTMQGDQDSSFWLLMCDVDKFKLVNDIYGHDVGDAVLVELANFTKEILGDDAVVSRLGGDEFAIMVGHQPGQGLTSSALEQLANKGVFKIALGDRSLQVGFSLGAAQYPRDANSFEKLLKQADLALLRSKKNKAGRIDFYDSQLGIEHERELNLFTEIQSAIEEGQIKPFFQPIFDSETQEIDSLEALARWEHPTRGLLMPGDFRKAFDDNGMSLELSKYILKTVTDIVTMWDREGIPVCPININVEASDLLNPSFMSDLLAFSTAGILHPQNLGLEITENSILNVDNQALIDSLTAIRSLGFQVLLDDFGTGFSSITHLDHLPITGLKLDKSYVQKVCSNDRSQKIVRAIVDLARNLDLSAIAEGIEDADALKAMQQIGCTAYQGYHFSQPLAASDVTTFLRTNSEHLPQKKSIGKHG